MPSGVVLKHVQIQHPNGMLVVAKDVRTPGLVAHICNHCQGRMLRVKPCPCPKGVECAHVQQPACDCYFIQERFCCDCGRLLGLSAPPYGDTSSMLRFI